VCVQPRLLAHRHDALCTARRTLLKVVLALGTSLPLAVIAKAKVQRLTILD
jgi:hypothetical protein